MTRKFKFRIMVYKRFLEGRLKSFKGKAYKVKLVKPTVKEIAKFAREAVPGMTFSNVFRDIRRVTEPGLDYDPEFDLLYRGQVVPEVIERYNEHFLAGLIKGVIAPSEMDRRLAALPRRTPDGRKIWEEV